MPTSSSPKQPQAERARWARVFSGLVLLLLLTTGCPPSDKPDADPDTSERPAVKPDPLTMLVISDDEIGDRIARQWSARRDGELTIANQSLTQWSENEFKIDPDVDVVVYPPQFLGVLVEADLIQPVPRDDWNSDTLNKEEYLTHFRRELVRYADQTFGVPLGCPNFAMAYRVPLFQNEDGDFPATWEQLESAITKLDPAAVPDGLTAKVDFPLGENWAAWTLLARVAPNIRVQGNYSSAFDRRTLDPLIDSPPYVEALEQIKRLASQRSSDLSPRDVYRLVAEGKSIAGVTWPARGFELLDQAEGLALESNDFTSQEVLAFDSLPGSKKLFQFSDNRWTERADTAQNRVDLIGFSGLMASVTTRSDHKFTAWDFLIWLGEKNMGQLVSADSPQVGMYRATHTGDPTAWTGDRLSYDVAQQYADVVRDAQERPVVLIFPRIPLTESYRQSLDAGIRKYLASEELSAQEALNEVARQWREITAQRGVNEQYESLRREYGF